MRRFLLGCAFFLSGATGLIYEVVWVRRLELTLGSTTHSIGLVLAVFMAGLGLGAWFFGRRAALAGSPARRYALLEAGIGIWGIASPWVLMAVDQIYAALGGAGGLLTKTVLAFLAMFPATFLMGGTLPVLATPLIDRTDGSARWVGHLYGWNTVGAVAGVLLADLVLVTTWGLALTPRWIGLANLVLAALAWQFGSRLIPSQEATEQSTQSAPRGPLLVAAGVGCLGLALEVGMTRALGVALGSTRHAFAIVLAATLLGIGVGSLLVARTLDAEQALRRLRWTLLAMAAGSWLFVALLLPLQELFFHLVQPRFLSYSQLLTAQFLILMAAIVPATIPLGAAFPLILRRATRQAHEGRAIGQVYLANTVGAILGSILASFVLLELLGTFRLLQFCGLLALVLAAVLLRQTPRAVATMLALLAIAIGLGSQPPWPSERIDFNPTRLRTEAVGRQRGNYRDVFQNGGFAQVYSQEGANAHVSVRQSGSLRQLKIGGKTDASTPNDMATQLLLGTVGFLARPTARTALVIGAGSGVTARVAADFEGVTHVEVVEIEPKVVDAARRHFADVHHNVFDRPHVTLTYDDARTVIRTHDRRFDVIISEPSNPYIAGIANLFTREHFQSARERLTDHGVYVQWIQLYDTDPRMLQSMVKTFLDTFDHAHAWWTYPSDLLLVGSASPLEMQPAQGVVEMASNAALMADLEPYLDCRSSTEIYSRFLVGRLALETMAAPGIVLTDDVPWLDARASRARYERRDPQATLSPLWQRAANRSWGNRTLAIRLAAARAIAPFSAEVAALYVGDLAHPQAEALKASLASAPSTRQQILANAMEENPEDPHLRFQLASLHVDAGDRALAAQLLAELYDDPLLHRAERYLLQARLLSPSTQETANQILDLVEAGLSAVKPREEEAPLRRQLLLRAAACARAHPRAIQLLQDETTHHPYDEVAHLALARAFLTAGQPERAVRSLDHIAAQNFMGANAELRLLRVHALVAMGSPDVREELERLLEDFPHQAENPDLAQLIPRLLDAAPR